MQLLQDLGHVGRVAPVLKLLVSGLDAVMLWYFQFTAAGRRSRVALGRYPAVTVSAAVKPVWYVCAPYG